MKTKPLFSRDYEYLLKFAERDLDPETLQAINDKRIIVDEEPLYVRKKITGGGEIDLLTSDLNESTGITNIDKQMLPKFVNFIVTGLRFGYASAPTADAKREVEVPYSAQQSAMPVVLQHANLIIRQNDTPILTEPIKELIQEEKTREFLGDAHYELKYLRTIKQNVKFQVSIRFPVGLALVGNVDHFVEVFIKGTRTRLRGAQ